MVSNSFTVELQGIKNVMGVLSRGQRFVRMELPKITQDEAEKGATYARNIAPLRTGALIQSIGTASRGKNTYSVVSRMPRGQKRRDGKPRPYHAMMHGLASPDTSGHRFNGDNKYMFTTLKRLKEGYPRRVRSRLRRAISGKEIYT